MASKLTDREKKADLDESSKLRKLLVFACSEQQRTAFELTDARRRILELEEQLESATTHILQAEAGEHEKLERIEEAIQTLQQAGPWTEIVHDTLKILRGNVK